MSLAVALIAGILGAQAPAASRDASDIVALRIWYKEGRCLEHERPKEAHQLLSTAPESMEFFTAFMRAAKGTSCFLEESAAAPKLHANATRGAVIEALLLKDFQAIGVPRGKPPGTRLFDATLPFKSAGLESGQTRARAFLRLAECVAAAQPADAFAVFSTEVGSDEEQIAVRKLVPSFQACMPPGLRLSITPSMFRSYLAEAAYRVSVQQLARAGS